MVDSSGNNLVKEIFVNGTVARLAGRCPALRGRRSAAGDRRRGRVSDRRREKEEMNM